MGTRHGAFDVPAMAGAIREFNARDQLRADPPAVAQAAAADFKVIPHRSPTHPGGTP